MANKHQVLKLFSEHPDWTSGQIAQRLGCDSAYVRSTLTRNGLKLAKPRGRTSQPFGWRVDVWNAPADEILNVVGRYLDVTAGFPRYAALVDGKWWEYSRGRPFELVVWAWRPRGDWPQEPDRADKGANLTMKHEAIQEVRV